MFASARVVFLDRAYMMRSLIRTNTGRDSVYFREPKFVTCGPKSLPPIITLALMVILPDYLFRGLQMPKLFGLLTHPSSLSN